MFKLYPILETHTKQPVSPLRRRSLSVQCSMHKSERQAKFVTIYVSNPKLNRLDEKAESESPSISSLKRILLRSLHDRITKVHRSRNQITSRLRHVQLRLTAERLTR